MSSLATTSVSKTLGCLGSGRLEEHFDPRGSTCNRNLLATCIHTGFLVGFFFDPEDGGRMSYRNIG
jgi:hypothetical protein